MKMTTYWENERRKLLGQPLIQDDDNQSNTAIDAPQAAVLAQAEELVPENRGIIDINNDVVQLRWNSDNTRITEYIFETKNERKLQKAKSDFFKYCKPILEIMHLTEMGRQDIRYLYNIPTETVIELYKTEAEYKLAHDNLDPEELSGIVEANSHINHPNGYHLRKGYYYDVVITPFLWKFAKYQQQNPIDNLTSFEEWLGSTMTVEVGHLMPEQIRLENDMTKKNKEWLKTSTNPEFKKAYTYLANRNVKWRYEYRKTFNIQMSKSIFEMLDNYNIAYDAENLLLRNQIVD